MTTLSTTDEPWRVHVKDQPVWPFDFKIGAGVHDIAIRFVHDEAIATADLGLGFRGHAFFPTRYPHPIGQTGRIKPSVKNVFDGIVVVLFSACLAIGDIHDLGTFLELGSEARRRRNASKPANRFFQKRR